MNAARACAQQAFLHAIFALALVMPGLTGGCYWLRYADLVRTHAELMEDLSVATLSTVEAAKPGLGPLDVERLRYPLLRASQFSEMARRRYPERASLDELEALVSEYSALVREVEKARIGATDLPRLRALVAGVAARAARVRAAVEHEEAG